MRLVVLTAVLFHVALAVSSTASLEKKKHHHHKHHGKHHKGKHAANLTAQADASAIAAVASNASVFKAKVAASSSSEGQILGRLKQLEKELNTQATAQTVAAVAQKKAVAQTQAEAGASEEAEDSSSGSAAADEASASCDGQPCPPEEPSTPAPQECPAPCANGIDIDTEMPYGDLEPFGREDTAQELTEQSISESNEMVDQLERAEVAEEKRAVFRALTRLRGAAITSFDGVARSQTGNIDEYGKTHQWRVSHPLHHLADEESDVSKWAFPDNAD